MECLGVFRSTARVAGWHAAEGSSLRNLRSDGTEWIWRPGPGCGVLQLLGLALGLVKQPASLCDVVGYCMASPEYPRRPGAHGHLPRSVGFWVCERARACLGAWPDGKAATVPGACRAPVGEARPASARWQSAATGYLQRADMATAGGRASWRVPTSGGAWPGRLTAPEHHATGVRAICEL